MNLKLRKFLLAMCCRVGLHDWEGKCANTTEQQGKTITLGWWECRRCAESKLKLILSNWEGTTP